MSPTKTLLRSLAAVLVSSGYAFGATLNVDTVLGPDHLYPNETITVVDGANPPTKVTILDGASIGDVLGGEIVPVGLDVFGSSEITMFGGGVSGGEHAVLLHDQSTFRMLGGGVDSRGIDALDESEAILDGGRWRFVSGFDSSVLRINGGGDGSDAVYGHENTRVAMTGGYPDDVFLYDNSTFVMHGGAINFTLETNGNSRALINGGTIGGLALAVLNDESVLTLRGGPQIAEFRVNDDALLHVYGFGLEFVFDEDLGHFVQGTLADGSVADFRYRLADQDQIILHEVPEPATWGLLAAGVATLLAARRFRR
jgi:hypothetical protein